MSAISLTVAQRKWLDRVDDKGRIRYMGPKGWGKSSWLGAMERVAGMGLVELDKGERFITTFRLTKMGEEYKRGTRIAEAVWKDLPHLREISWKRASRREECSSWANAPCSEVTDAGAKERWLDLKARRVFVRGGIS